MELAPGKIQRSVDFAYFKANFSYGTERLHLACRPVLLSDFLPCQVCPYLADNSCSLLGSPIFW